MSKVTRVLLKCSLRRAEDEPAGRPLTCQAGEQQRADSVMNHGAADGLNGSVTIHALIIHWEKKALPTVITHLHRTETIDDPMFLAQESNTLVISWAHSLQRVCVQAADVPRGFCLLWPVFVSFVPGTLTQCR